MMEFIIHLEARDPERNIWRSYAIAAGQDIFGDWIVELTYGRIGSKGHHKTLLMTDETETRRYVRECLKRRESAPKRIGIGYKITSASGIWGDLCDGSKDLANA